MNETRPVTGSLVLLDANVLYPISVCDFFLTASSLQLLARPVVSADILDEASRNITADRPAIEPARIVRRFDAVRAVTDGHDEPVTRRVVDSWIINAKDRHVLAAALQHEVDFVITNDARFRAEITEWLAHRHGRYKLLAALSPNQLTAALVAESPDQVTAVLTAMAARLRNPTRTVDEVRAALLKPLPALAIIDPRQ